VAPHNKKCHIVSGRNRCSEATEIVEHSVAHGVRAVFEALSQGTNQAIVLIIVAGWIRGFGDAVGVQDEALSLLGSVLGYGVLSSREEAKRQTVRIQTFGSMMEEEKGRAVSCVADLETVRGGSAAHEGCVVGGAGALAEESVGARDDLGQRQVHR